MTRLPTVGGDDGSWGTVLNQYLSIELDTDGTLKKKLLTNFANLEDYGAAGDGTTDDTVAIRTAIATGKHLFCGQGKTYLINGGFALSAGQIVFGNGATFKRNSQVVTTTDTTITNGSTTSITVADSTGMTVGMDLAFSQGSQSGLTAEVDLATNNPTVSAINGNTITLDTAPNTSFSGTTDVYTAYYVFTLNDDCRVYDIFIDGNKSNYTRARWETTRAISFGGDRSLAENCKLSNCPGECFYVTGLYNTVKNGWALDANGNGVHLSAATNPKIDGLHVVNANLDTTIGHAAGCIGSSTLFTDTIITNCFLSGSSVAGIGFSLASASHNTFSNNVIRDCGYGIYITGACSNLIINNNRIYDCTTRGMELISLSTGKLVATSNQVNSCDVKISGSGGTETAIQFSDNQINTGDIILVSSKGAKVIGNSINGGQVSIQSSVTFLDLSNNTIDNTGDTTTVGIVLGNTGNEAINISNNTILEGAEGVQLSCSSSIGIKVANNVLSGQVNHGVYNALSGAIPGSSISNNYIESTATSSSNWQGIGGATYNLQIIGNHIYGVSSHANYGILVTTPGTGTALLSNYVRGTFANNTIRILSGTGIVVMNNITTAAILDNGTTTVLANNEVVS